MNSDFTKPQNLDSLLMKPSQSNSNLRSPGFCLVRSYLITTVSVCFSSELLENQNNHFDVEVTIIIILIIFDFDFMVP